MNTQLLIIFIVANIANVVIQTVKSLATIKCGKGVAALVNAVAYGFYTYIIILTTCDLPLLWKALIVGACNLVGVFVVKWAEEKARKDKLWKVEATVFDPNTFPVWNELQEANIPCNYIPRIGKWSVFNIYCETKEQSQKAKEILNKYEAKYFVSESKTL